MTIAVTAATGKLGRLVVADLLTTESAESIVAIVRDPRRATALVEAGVQVRVADYDHPHALGAALQGVDRVLLISGLDLGRRVRQHGNVIAAARGAGVDFLAYTSAPHADETPLPIAAEHAATERLVRESGLHFSMLRNNWYNENYSALIDRVRETGEIVGNAGTGRIASAARADYAAAAAAVLRGGHDDTVYELAGDRAWDFAELAQILTGIVGREVVYRSISADHHIEELIANCVPTDRAAVAAALDTAIEDGALSDASGDLRRLIGRPTTPITETLRTASARVAAN
ncbi:MAG: SDR family oxidoreductase [Lacisediminihabitans sp.]